MFYYMHEIEYLHPIEYKEVRSIPGWYNLMNINSVAMCMCANQSSKMIKHTGTSFSQDFTIAG